MLRDRSIIFPFFFFFLQHVKSHFSDSCFAAGCHAAVDGSLVHSLPVYVCSAFFQFYGGRAAVWSTLNPYWRRVEALGSCLLTCMSWSRLCLARVYMVIMLLQCIHTDREKGDGGGGGRKEEVGKEKETCYDRKRDANVLSILCIFACVKKERDMELYPSLFFAHHEPIAFFFTWISSKHSPRSCPYPWKNVGIRRAFPKNAKSN